jgi:PIN like domain
MSEYGFQHDTPDIVWMARLGRDQPSDWIIITGDQRIRKNMAERKAWVIAELKGFLLAPAYQKNTVNQCASVLLWRWPEMERFISLAAPGSLFEMSINRRAGFRPLPTG